ATRSEDTDWAAIADLYTLLPATPVVELNRAAAVSMVHGPEATRALVEPLAADLAHYYLYAATVADLTARLGRVDEAAGWLATAIQEDPTRAQARRARERTPGG